MTQTNEKLEALLAYVQAEGRICPKPQLWNELWKMIPNKQRVGSRWEPPLPLILAAWSHSTGLEKMLRLEEHIMYAAKHGVLDEVDHYFRQLSRNDWHTASKG
jgi:hypothetical protein